MVTDFVGKIGAGVKEPDDDLADAKDPAYREALCEMNPGLPALAQMTLTGAKIQQRYGAQSLVACLPGDGETASEFVGRAVVVAGFQCDDGAVVQGRCEPH
jgi:hypothetical protein